MQRFTLSAVNRLEPAAFEAAFGHLCEHAPWVARRVTDRRPFVDQDAIRDGFRTVIDAASRAEQLTLLRNHPELAGKAAIAGDLTEDSRKEQAGAGLTRLTPEEYARFHELNRAYTAKFGFPFILAVKGRSKGEILAAFAARLDNDRETEFRTALDQVARIIEFRLADLLE